MSRREIENYILQNTELYDSIILNNMSLERLIALHREVRDRKAEAATSKFIHDHFVFVHVDR